MFRFSLPLPPEPHSFFLTEQSIVPFSRENMVVLFVLSPCYRSFLLLKLTVFSPVFSVHLLRLVIAKHFVLQVTWQSWPSLLPFARMCSLSVKLRDIVALTFACDGMSTKDLFAGMRGRKGENIEKEGSNEPETKGGKNDLENARKRHD